MAPAYPLAKSLQIGRGKKDWVCQACRQDDRLYISLFELDASQHSIFQTNGPDVATHLQLLSGGKILQDRTNDDVAELNVPADQANYRLVEDMTKTVPWLHQSNTVHTEWTFGSAHSGTRTVPEDWQCPPTFTSTDCSALPLVMANYQLGVGLDGTSPPGPDQLTLALAHATGATNAPFAKATVEVSFDGGTTWTPTALFDLGGGKYRALWVNPLHPKQGDVALRISGTDVNGNSLTQTVTNAFDIAGR